MSKKKKTANRKTTKTCSSARTAKRPAACATLGCDAPAVTTYLGRRRCQACFEADTALETPTKKTSRRAKGAAGPKRLSALDAAAQVLAASEKPLRAKDLIDAMAAQGLWSSPAGKTPHATLYAAILREIQTKGAAARFHKVERGLFAHA